MTSLLLTCINNDQSLIITSLLLTSLLGSNATVARHIFQACPVWIYTQSNITQAFYSPEYITPTQQISVSYCHYLHGTDHSRFIHSQVFIHTYTIRQKRIMCIIYLSVSPQHSIILHIVMSGNQHHQQVPLVQQVDIVLMNNPMSLISIVKTTVVQVSAQKKDSMTTARFVFILLVVTKAQLEGTI